MQRRVLLVAIPLMYTSRLKAFLYKIAQFTHKTDDRVPILLHRRRNLVNFDQS
jgi:hypothetical protein